MKPATSTKSTVSAVCKDCGWEWEDSGTIGRPKGTPIGRARKWIAEHVESTGHRVALRLLTVHHFEP